MSFGVAVYGPSGEEVFGIGKKYMAILGHHAVPSKTWDTPVSDDGIAESTGSIAFTAPGGESVWVLPDAASEGHPIVLEYNPETQRIFWRATKTMRSLGPGGPARHTTFGFSFSYGVFA